MNEQAQKILVDLLQKASNGIDSAVSFSHAQIPDVVHQLLVWNFTSSLLYQALSILVMISTLKIFCSAYKCRGEKRKDNHYLSSDRYENHSFLWESDGDFSEAGVLYTIAAGFGWVISITTILFSFDWLKIWLAPKLYLIEYAASLVK